MTYSPWAELAKRPDIRVQYAEMDDRHGCYDRRSRTIWLDPRSSQAELRATLCHELRHVESDDECSGSEHVDRAMERRADVAAARLLIPLDRLIHCLLWSYDENELAEGLWVDAATVRTRLENLTDDEHEQIAERLWAREGGAA